MENWKVAFVSFWKVAADYKDFFSQETYDKILKHWNLSYIKFIGSLS